jgi:RimJ/RimL family protein N-acetyltransferase
MTGSVNAFGQPVGPALPDWQGAAHPSRAPTEGRLCRVEPLDPDAHADDLFDACSDDGDGVLWTYMAVGPFESRHEFRDWLASASETDDPLFFSIIDLATGKAIGLAAYMRIRPDVGVIEVGSITYSPRMQKTAMATEAMYLMMARAFDELGYRRYEWKCDALNAGSRAAAERLGFVYEGTFRQATHYKGRNRDTAWYAVIDKDWPKIDGASRRWLDPENFDEDGRQKSPLRLR